MSHRQGPQPGEGSTTVDVQKSESEKPSISITIEQDPWGGFGHHFKKFNDTQVDRFLDSLVKVEQDFRVAIDQGESVEKTASRYRSMIELMLDEVVSQTPLLKSSLQELQIELNRAYEHNEILEREIRTLKGRSLSLEAPNAQKDKGGSSAMDVDKAKTTGVATGKFTISSELTSEEEESEHVLPHFSALEQPLVNLAKQALIPLGDMEFEAVDVTGRAYYTSPAVMDKTKAPALVKRWASLFGARTAEENQLVLTTICLYFAVNSTSPRLPSKERIDLKFGDRKVSVGLVQIRDAAFDVTGETELRKVMRAFADFTREALVRNKRVRTNMFSEFKLPENFRHIAFDCADFCEAPALTLTELKMLDHSRRYLLNRTRRSDEQAAADAEFTEGTSV